MIQHLARLREDNGSVKRSVALGAMALLGIMVMAGCSNPEAKVLGKWDVPGGSAEFKPDHTVDITFAGAGNMSIAIAGTWKLEKETVTVTTTTVNGKSVDNFAAELKKTLGAIPGVAAQIDNAAKTLKTLEMKLDESGKTLASTGAVGAGNLTLTRKAEG